LAPKQVTLNDHFALKYVSGSASNGLAFWLSVKTVRKFDDDFIGMAASWLD